MIRRLLTEKRIILGMRVTSKESAIKQLVGYVAPHLNSQETYLSDVLKRESEISTGIVNGIAIPHSQSDGVNESFIAVATLESALDWGTVDGSKVKFIILIGVPKQNLENEHLQILSKIAEILMDDEVCNVLVESNDKREIIKLLGGEL